MGKIERRLITKIPQTTGVYQFIGKGRKILYVGKAVNLKARIASHFENAKKDPKEALILASSLKIKTIATPSEFQALLLETQLIKKHKPKYNSVWKDDKSYLYIWITREKYPKVLLARARDIRANPKGLFFGPFQGTRTAEEVIHEIRKIIPFCTRKRISGGACFHSKIGQCDPCPNKVASIESQVIRRKLKKQYRRNIRQVISIFQGKAKPVLDDLKKKMEQASHEERFEEAVIARNRITRFEKLLTQTLRVKEGYRAQPDALGSLRQLLSKHLPTIKNLNRIEAYDISNLSQREPAAAMVVATNGQIDKSRYRKFKIRLATRNSLLATNLGDVGMLVQVFERRFKNRWPNPDLIVVDGGKPQVRITQEALVRIGKKIPIIGIAKAPDRLIVGTGRLTTTRPQLSNPGFNLVQLLRDEAHRFSRKYHRALRHKKLLGF